MNITDLLKLVIARRSIRRFKPDPLPDEHIEKILAVSRWAPSGANSQPWDLIVVKNQEMRKKIIQLFDDPEPRFKDAPVIIVICMDPRTTGYYPNVLRARAEPERIAVTFHSSLANVAMYIQLAATALGIGSHWRSAPHSVRPGLKDLLGIPAELAIYCLIPMGYPAESPRPRFIRELTDVVHDEKYDQTRFTTSEELQEIIKALNEERRQRQVYGRGVPQSSNIE